MSKKVCPKFYCKIKLCKNEIGTSDRNIKFFAVPRQGKMRKKWIDAITNYQDFDYYSIRFILCQLHFQANDFETKQNKLVLKKGSVPSIFGRPENMLTTNTESVRFRNDPKTMQIIPKTEPDDDAYYADPLFIPLQSSAAHVGNPRTEQTQSLEFDCKECTRLQIDLLNALQRINSLEESLDRQGKVLAHTNRILASFKEENRKLKEKRNKLS